MAVLKILNSESVSLNTFAIANATGLLWSHHKSRVVWFYRIVTQLKLVSLQQDAPNDLDLLMGERHTQATMPSSAEPDE